jgi:hypothetical protein
MISSNFKLISSVFPEISNGPSENSVTPMSKPTLVNDRDTIDVVVGIHLDGRKNQTGFMDEWEVHLKSLMIHAPLDFNLHVHIITNQKALLSIQQRLELSGLHHFQFRNKVTLTCYVVDKYEITWEEFIYNKTNKTPFQSAKNIYTTGAYYRLMADRYDFYSDSFLSFCFHFHLSNLYPFVVCSSRVLPKDLVNVIYSDTDVVFNSNLNALYPYLDPKKHTQWLQIGKTGCSGFIILNLKTFGSHFWTTIDVLAQQKISFGGVHDQYLLRLVRENSPLNSTGILPDEWNIHYSDHHRDPSSIMELEIAFLHFNGMRNQLRGFWEG